jgi:hypothetical protein
MVRHAAFSDRGERLYSQVTRRISTILHRYNPQVTLRCMHDIELNRRISNHWSPIIDNKWLSHREPHLVLATHIQLL